MHTFRGQGRTGEEALLMMLSDGADMVAGGVYTRHLIEELKTHKAAAFGC